MGKLRKVTFGHMLPENYTSNKVCYTEVLKDWYLSLDMKRIKRGEMYKAYRMNWTVEKHVLILIHKLKRRKHLEHLDIGGCEILMRVLRAILILITIGSKVCNGFVLSSIGTSNLLYCTLL